VFERLTAGEKNAKIREYWLRTKEQGKSRFIWRQMLASLLLWLLLTPTVEVFAVPVSSVRLIVFTSLITLPIFLLGGYLEGRWKWTDLEKKYPAETLPPWE
jgi:hypothetical protein